MNVFDPTTSVINQMNSGLRSIYNALDKQDLNLLATKELDVLKQSVASKDELDVLKQSVASKDELDVLKQSVASKAELDVLKQSVASKDELDVLKQSVASKDEVNKQLATKVTRDELNDRIETLRFTTASNDDINDLKGLLNTKASKEEMNVIRDNTASKEEIKELKAIYDQLSTDTQKIKTLQSDIVRDIFDGPTKQYVHDVEDGLYIQLDIFKKKMEEEMNAVKKTTCHEMAKQVESVLTELEEWKMQLRTVIMNMDAGSAKQTASPTNEPQSPTTNESESPTSPFVPQIPFVRPIWNS